MNEYLNRPGPAEYAEPVRPAPARPGAAQEYLDANASLDYVNQSPQHPSQPHQCVRRPNRAIGEGGEGAEEAGKRRYAY